MDNIICEGYTQERLISMIANLRQSTVRSATEADLQRLANLIHFETYVHRHLDWRTPLDWISQQPYLVLEQDSELLAALACPPDPPNVAWIRMFAVSSKIQVKRAWMELWPAARTQLNELTDPEYVAAIPLQNWFRKLLEESEFFKTHDVMVLTWSPGDMPPVVDATNATIRPMKFEDLAIVEEIDAAAFGGVWQNTQSCLEIAYHQAVIATVAEISGKLVGYQISTATAMGGHLARLAVKPQFQGLGVGYALVSQMLSKFERRGVSNVTVNTQKDNLNSLSLYQKAGFTRSGEEYPVYQFPSRITPDLG